jgi:hypothetical protein
MVCVFDAVRSSVAAGGRGLPLDTTVYDDTSMRVWPNVGALWPSFTVPVSDTLSPMAGKAVADDDNPTKMPSLVAGLASSSATSSCRKKPRSVGNVLIELPVPKLEPT